MADLPPPPPGFKLDAAPAAVPPPPPGFTLDGNRSIRDLVAGGQHRAPPDERGLFPSKAFPSDPPGMSLEKADQFSPMPPPPDVTAKREQRREQLRSTGGSEKTDPEMRRLNVESARSQLAEPEAAAAFPPTEGGLMQALKGTLKRAFVKADPTTAARLARDVGYVLPPTQIAPESTLATKAGSAWSGKVKMQQAASAKNQEVTNKLAAKALGLPEDTTLTDKVFKDVRAEAGKAYGDVAKAVPSISADKEFITEIEALGGANSQAAELFPGIMKNSGVNKLIGTVIKAVNKTPQVPTDAALEVVKKLRFNASGNLKAIGDPSKHALGLAQREAADAIDGLIERNIIRQKALAGGTDIVDKYRAARQLIAKSYDVEAVTNTGDGAVSAMGLARLANKGRPLSGELDTIAHTANAFPKAMQNPERFGGIEDWSIFDFGGTAASVVSGRPDLAAIFLGRPLVRAGMLSGPAQNLLASGASGAAAKGAGLGSLTPAAALALMSGERQQ